ncbi:hypothetical protein Tsubulata_035143 [Turnera subulata]|uniref:Uncharacterized protein n=1 Tax=Turnera subulata TaxID=218843 RepID=A0A9Q0G0L2_9ROSI|nr:hypothetical protein Tsubulata_035143 [Turnera subulata]
MGSTRCYATVHQACKAPYPVCPIAKIQTAMESLSSILTPPTLPSFLLSSPNPAASLLLHHRDISCQISALLHQSESEAGDNNLCWWLYDTFQSSQQLVVLWFLPTIAGLYLSLVALWKPLAGFEAVLLALYSHEATSRSGLGCDGGDEVASDGGVRASVVEDELGLVEVWLGN